MKGQPTQEPHTGSVPVPSESSGSMWYVTTLSFRAICLTTLSHCPHHLWVLADWGQRGPVHLPCPSEVD